MRLCPELLVPSRLPPLPQVREDLDGCIEGVESIYEVWFRALDALKALSGTLDDACLDRLFWRENRMVTLPHRSAATCAPAASGSTVYWDWASYQQGSTSADHAPSACAI